GDAVAATAALSLQYQVDFGASGSLFTARLAQAIASLQSLLLLIRSGDNTDLTGAAISGWQLTHDEATFDSASAWMGTAAGGRSATTTFLCAEAALDPFLIQQTQTGSSPSTHFEDLCNSLALSIGSPDTGSGGAVHDYQSAVTAALRTINVLGANDTLT